MANEDPPKAEVEKSGDSENKKEKPGRCQPLRQQLDSMSMNKQRTSDESCSVGVLLKVNLDHRQCSI